MDCKATSDQLLENASIAAAEFSELDQKITDRIVEAVHKAALNNRISLAKIAYEETGIGVWQHKVIKNAFAALLVYEDIKNLRTAGIISQDKITGITEFAQPLGPIVAVIPTTNPTSTVIFKSMISLKARNPIIFSPHPRAIKSTCEAARICYEAALEAGAPELCIQWTPEPSVELTHALMSHKSTSLVLATGGPNLVKAAYSSGTPAFGVGSGNVPVYIDKSADIGCAVESIILSKTFDNGTVCASEQAIVVATDISLDVEHEFSKRGGYFLNANEISLLEKIAINNETKLMNPAIVGKPASFIAKTAGINVPDGTVLLLAAQDFVDEAHPLSGEILAPVLAYYKRDSFEDAVKTCIDLNYRGGIGHTASIYSKDDSRIDLFAELMNAGRVVVNTPSSQGGIGQIYNTLRASLTLGCGAGGKNITTENISAMNLINVKRLCRRRDNNKWLDLKNDVWLDESKNGSVIDSIYDRK